MYIPPKPVVAISCQAAKCACSGGILPLLRWDDAVRWEIWKAEVALQSDAAVSAQSFACLHSPSNVRITRRVVRQESAEADMLLVSRRRRAEGNEGTIGEGL